MSAKMLPQEDAASKVAVVLHRMLGSYVLRTTARLLSPPRAVFSFDQEGAYGQC